METLSLHPLFPRDPNKETPPSTQRHPSDDKSPGLPSTARPQHPHKSTKTFAAFAAGTLEMRMHLLRCTCTITHLYFRSLGTVGNYWAEQVSGQTLAICFHQHSIDTFLSSFPNVALSFFYGEQSLGLLRFLLPLPHILRVRVWQQGCCLCHLSPRGPSIYQCLTAFYVKQVIKLIRNWLLLQTPFE